MMEILNLSEMAPTPEWTWYIDHGPFYDRFGPVWLAVFTSTNPVVVALRANLAGRKWIDLKRADLYAGLMYMTGADSLGIGSLSPPISGVTEALVDTIINTPVSATDNLATRTVYFSGR